MNDISILNYWIDIEANTPPEVLVEQYYMKEKNVHNQIITRYTEKMNWDTNPNMKHQVYVGVVSVNEIISKLKGSDVENEDNYSSCLASFEVGANGYPLIDSFKIPQYIISMVQEHFNESFQFWRNNDFYKHAKESFAEWAYKLKAEKNGTQTGDISELLENLIGFMKIFKWNVNIKDTAYVESVNPDLRFPSNYMDSFVLNDLILVRNSLMKNKRINSSSVEMYLKSDFTDKENINMADNIDNLKSVLAPELTNYAAWPGEGAFPLVTAQQVALNLLFNYYVKPNASGVFAVNGPPGTGKTTLIQSMIANIVFLRASKLYYLHANNIKPFNFVAAIKIDNEDVMVYEPVKELQGFEIVITSSNNNAVKNITEELPLVNGLHERSLGDFDYFKNVSDEIIGSPTWGLIATTLGNKDNNEVVIDAFSKKKHNLTDEIIGLNFDEECAVPHEFKVDIAHLKYLFDKYAKNDFDEGQYSYFQEAIPDEKFWNGSIEDIHMASPWNNEEINIKKGKTFVSSLKMHKKLISDNKEVFIGNLKVMKLILQGKIYDKRIIKAAWKTYFLLCPVVSTTFSSLGKVFKNLGEGELGYMFVDEAGQAKPQDLVGGLWRSRIGCIIGDPRQITPVNNISESVNDCFKEKNNVSDNWDILTNSAQVIADRVSPYGSSIRTEEGDVWVGAPLRVHRRCASPMFEISNKIAYGGKMIHAKNPNQKSEMADILGKSCWFDIKSSTNDFEGYWVESQYEFLKIKLAQLMEEKERRGLPNLYIISPYKDVALKTIQMLIKESSSWIPNDYDIDNKTLSNWLYKSVGTIHTFQGKEADVVFLLLGGNPKKDVTWATSSPNIINVAATRAKNALYIIGDKVLWNKGVITDVIEILDNHING
jgi:hypothetical protein